MSELEPSDRKLQAPPGDPEAGPALVHPSPAELGGFDILRHVKLERLEALVEHGTLRWLRPGDALLCAGERNSVLFLVLSGAFGVHLAGAGADPIAIVYAGESLGELSVLDQKAASADVIAREPSCVLAVPEREFFALLETSHAFAVNLLFKLADRLRSSNLAISESVQLREEAFERAAEHDALTGVCNRRWLDTVLPRWIERHARSGRPLSIALVDVDDLKELNDRHGHAAGDLALASVVEVLRSGLRQSDRIARYGGDEFALLLPEADRVGGSATCDRLRERVAQHVPCDSSGRPLPSLTVSMGIAEWSHPLDAAGLLAAADAALYRAKRAGRNRCES